MSTPEFVLLDTHAVLWWNAASSKLSKPARQAIDAAAEVRVSPISCWEVAMLMAKGRVTLDRPLEEWVADLLGEHGPARVAPVTPEIGVEAGQIAELHGDPADRIIYATARLTSVPLVTLDPHLHDAALGDPSVTILW